MTALKELYYLLGYLEGLAMKVEVFPGEMDKVKSVIQSIVCYKETSANCDEDDYDIVFMDNPVHRNWTEEDYAEAGWDIDDLNPAHDPSQNPWIDVSGPGEEAEMAYWNHD